MYCKGLTRKELEEYGIVDVKWNTHTNNWCIVRYWYKNNSKDKRYNTLHPGLIVQRHRYGKDKYYYKFQINYKGGSKAWPLSRFIYAWFVGDIPDGDFVVDHIDNNPLNNQLNNLQLLTIEENNRKRFEDLDLKCINQYHNTTR